MAQTGPTPYIFPTLAPTATYPPELATLVAKENCMRSFDEFAYQGTMNQTHLSTLPQSPWQYEATIPTSFNEWHLPGYFDQQVKLARWMNGEQEIWVKGWELDQPVWFIYRPASFSWERVSRAIDGTELFGDDLFLFPDGTVWSNVEWYTWGDNIPNRETAPVLSRFDENTRQFVIPDDMMETHLTKEERIAYSHWSWPKIVLGEGGDFWIFDHYDGLYRYNPIEKATEKRVDWPEYPVYSIALSPDGSLYFSIPKSGSSYAVVEGMILQFVPETDEVIQVDIPDEPWPKFQGMLVDQSGRLWLGSTGYRDIDGDWHLILPDPQVVFDHAGEFWWFRPYILTESSDGKQWYIRFIDGGGDGTAWYDPKTGEGCQITDYTTNIVEDSNQQLWLLADGKLFVLPRLAS